MAIHYFCPHFIGENESRDGPMGKRSSGNCSACSGGGFGTTTFYYAKGDSSGEHSSLCQRQQGKLLLCLTMLAPTPGSSGDCFSRSERWCALVILTKATDCVFLTCVLATTMWPSKTGLRWISNTETHENLSSVWALCASILGARDTIEKSLDSQRRWWRPHKH